MPRIAWKTLVCTIASGCRLVFRGTDGAYRLLRPRVARIAACPFLASRTTGNNIGGESRTDGRWKVEGGIGLRDDVLDAKRDIS